MPPSGTSTYADPDDYQANVRGARVELVLACRGDFKARLTWVELRHLHLLRSQESLPRITYVALAPERFFVAFPTHNDPPPIWGGVKVKSGDIFLHAIGARMHQRTMASSRWGFLSLTPEYLSIHSKALTGSNLVPPAVCQILRPPRPATAQLLRLHAQACQLAETKPEIFAHREVVRSLEQNLAHALVNCLADNETCTHAPARHNHRSIMVRFEHALEAHFHQPLHIPDLCAAIGVPERTLRICCAEALGMGPSRYHRLRRLNLMRAVFRRADPSTESVAESARRYGFSEPGRFAVIYRALFGESPSTTLRNARSLAGDAASAGSA